MQRKRAEKSDGFVRAVARTKSSTDEKRTTGERPISTKAPRRAAGDKLREEDLDRIFELFESHSDEGKEARARTLDVAGVPEARRFLKLLVDAGHLELDDAGAEEKLAPRLAELLAAEEDTAKKAARVSGWLVEEDSVVDLYLDDTVLAQLLAVW